MYRLARLSLANRSVVALITVIVVAFGALSLTSLKQELLPSFETPQAAIITSYPGASAEVVDKQVSQKVEAQVRTLDGLVTTTSTSQNNLSIVRVEFEYGTTSAKVKENLNAAIAAVEASLPEEANANVVAGSFDSVPIISIGVSSEDNEKLGPLLEDVAPSVFGSIDGVRDINVTGMKTKRINLKLDTALLTKNGLSQQSVSAALQQSGFVLPAGSIRDSEGELNLQVGTPVETVAALKKIALTPPASAYFRTTMTMMGPVTVPVTPKVYTIGEVAKVTYDYAPVTTISRVNGKEALAVTVTKTQDGNTVTVTNGVEDRIEELKKELGGNVEVAVIFEQGSFVEKSLEQLTTEGLLGLGFAILIILLFLLSVRSTLVTAISIPTSLLITFIGLGTLGYSLNLLTLSALTISIGRVVDDSIVVIENINRHLSYGEPKKKAILRAVKEVSGAITAATITTVAVFLPIVLLPGTGIVGELFRPFSYTFAFALIASLLVSLTIVPVVAYWFLKTPEEKAFKTEAAAKKHAEEVREAEEAKERKSILQRGYLPIIRETQKHPVITVVASFIILVLTFSISGLLKTDFIGSSGSGSVIANQTLPAGATLKDQSEAAGKLEAIITAEDSVKVVLTTIGSSGDSRTALGLAAGGIQHQITLEEGEDLEAFKAMVLKAAEADPTMGEIKFNEAGGGSFGGSSTVDVTVTANDDEALVAGVEAVAKALDGAVGTTETNTSLADKQRTVQITVDRKKAAAKGLSEIALSGIVAGLMQPTSIGSINVEGVSTNIYIVPKKPATTLKQIRNLSVPTATGNVKLSSLAKVSVVEIPVSITTEKGDRTAKVMLTPDGENLGATTVDVNERLDKLSLPAGVTASLGGISASQADSFAALGVGLLLSIAIVFVVMVATFNSIRQPLVLLISIPFAATGAFVALLITDTALDISALIGMLLLVGIVVTNAIVLIDLINQYRREGKPIQEAIMDGARQRLRPILMTALATIFALSPLAIGITGSGGFISQPLAIVVIGGLFSSTVLTLVIVPVLYWLIEGGKERKALKPRKVKTAKA